ncbi:hypothetical protein MBGDF03_00808 [Thermoplasmatales archaeon SCGC AB-540-F20]|nr:hypothetical protein MBGDF03_00808 [Thermoplasmatales archaeon SCGC AB-540-F20]
MYKKIIKRWIPEIVVIIIFCILFVYMEITVNHPLEGLWYCEDTEQYVEFSSYLDEGGNHLFFDGYFWTYGYDIFSKELTIDGYESSNYSDHYHSFIVKLRAEVIDEKLYLDFIESSDGVVRFDKMVLTRIY